MGTNEEKKTLHFLINAIPFTPFLILLLTLSPTTCLCSSQSFACPLLNRPACILLNSLLTSFPPSCLPHSSPSNPPLLHNIFQILFSFKFSSPAYPLPNLLFSQPNCLPCFQPSCSCSPHPLLCHFQNPLLTSFPTPFLFLLSPPAFPTPCIFSS